MNNSRKRLFLFLSGVIIAFILIYAGARIYNSRIEAKKQYQYVTLFSEVVSEVKNNYVEDVNPEDKFPGAFSGMLSSLDKFSTYLDIHQTRLYDLYKQNKAYTCGIYGTKLSNYFFITDIVKDSPADQAGLKPGYIIRAVNGKSIFGLAYWQMVLSLISEKPATIELMVFKKDVETPIEYKLETTLLPNSTSIRKLENNIYLIELSRFDNASASTLKSFLTKEIHPEKSNEPLKLILDLRKYIAGDLEPFIEFAGLLLNKSIPVTLKLKKENRLLSLGSPKAPKARIVVIINKSTLMYGELLAGLFRAAQTKENKNSVTLIGSTTRGFTSQLIQLPLSDGSSILLTEGFFLFEGQNPAKTGVKPDIQIKEAEFSSVIQRSMSLLN